MPNRTDRHEITASVLSPPIIGIVAVFLSVVWMLRNEKDKTRPLLVFALILNLFYGVLLTIAMGREDSLLPWKYDDVLLRMDRSLGISAASVALPLQGVWRIPLVIVYELMVPMMIVWFLAVRDEDRRKSIVLTYIAELVTGPILYAILPACGPIYVSRANWLNPPSVQTQTIRLVGMPNAFPSLHVGTAFVFVLFARGKLLRGISLVFFAGTILATLSTGEHYAIDLIPGLAFGCYATAAGWRRMRRALLYLSVVLAWSLAVRFEYADLAAHPTQVKTMAVLTVALAVWALVEEWSAANGVRPMESNGYPRETSLIEDSK